MQAMRELIRGSLARSLRQLEAEDRLAAALPVVCGSALAARCSVDRLTGEGVLHLRVQGAEWEQALWGMRERVQSDLARVAGVPVSGLHFHEAGSAPDRPLRSTRTGERTQEAPGRQRSARLASAHPKFPRRPA